MKLSYLLDAVNCPASNEDVEITGISADSRTVEKGYIFVCVKGKNQDGADYAGEAVSRGACAIVTEQRLARDDVIQIITENARALLSRMAAVLYSNADKSTGLIAVTGTNGKTSTAHMISHVLRHAGYSVGVIGTVGSMRDGEYIRRADGMTTPPAEVIYREIGSMAAAGADFIVMEASSQGIVGERLAGLPYTGCRLAAAVFTNLSHEHMDAHGDMETYFGVKSRLFGELDFDFAVINIDDEYGRRIETRSARVTVGKNGDYVTDDVALDENGVGYMLKSENVWMSVRCPVQGDFTVMNTAEALVTAMLLGVDAATASAAISCFPGVAGRMERVVFSADDDISVIIDYAHTPEAMRVLLKSVRKTAQGRITVLFGCGGDRDMTKRPEMGRTAEELADYVIITSDNSRNENTEKIIREILRGMSSGASYSIIPDRREAIKYAIENAHVGDTVILAGKGHEDYEDSNGVRTRFCEREIAYAALRGRREK